MYYVYILYSRSIDKYYIGSSQNPKKRLMFHNLGKGGRRAFTKRANDWELVYKKLYPTKSEALKFEAQLKQSKSRKVIEQVIKSKPLIDPR